MGAPFVTLSVAAFSFIPCPEKYSGDLAGCNGIHPMHKLSYFVSYSALHQEQIFLMIVTTRFPIIQEFPWLQAHNPQILWISLSLPVSPSSIYCMCVVLTMVENPWTKAKVEISKEYMDLNKEYRSVKARGLPSNCTYAFELMAGTAPPQNQIYYKMYLPGNTNYRPINWGGSETSIYSSLYITRFG